MTAALFNYDVDPNTVAACLGIIARAAERVERGKSAILEPRSAAKVKLDVRASLVRRRRELVDYREIEALWETGLSQAAIAARIGCGLSTVKNFTATLGRRGISRRMIA